MLIPLRLRRQCQMSAHVICQAVLPTATPPIPTRTRTRTRTWRILHLANIFHLAMQASFRARPPGSLVQSLELTGLQARSPARSPWYARGNDDDNDIDMSSIMRCVTLGMLRLNENY